MTYAQQMAEIASILNAAADTLASMHTMTTDQLTHAINTRERQYRRETVSAFTPDFGLLPTSADLDELPDCW